MKLAKLGKHTITLNGRPIELWIGKDMLILVAPENAQLQVTAPLVLPYTFKHKEAHIQIKNW